MSNNDHDYKSFMLDTMINKIISPAFRDCLISRQSDYLLRFFRPLIEKTQKNDFSYYSPVNRLIRLWNLLPLELRDSLLQNPSKETIKLNVLEYF